MKKIYNIKNINPFFEGKINDLNIFTVELEKGRVIKGEDLLYH